MRPPTQLALWLAASLACACSWKPLKQKPAPAASAKPKKPLDHLAPDELAPGTLEVYGFPVPRGMQLESRLKDRAYISGRVSPEALANYVREHVSVSHVEIGAARTIFPMARIKAGPRDKSFTLEVLPDGPKTRLIIKDTTPPPPPPPGLSDEERWRRAGLKPDGSPLDMNTLQ